ncbi:MAG: toprim domain-containing protein [Desulfurobacteriaceae bacterium]
MEEIKLLKNFLLELKLFSIKNTSWAILVEGKRDKAALEIFEIQNVVDLKGRNFHDLAEDLSTRFEGIVILTDFDREGEVIFQKLSKLLPVYGLKIDSSFREKLRKTGIQFIEKIPKKLIR